MSCFQCDLEIPHVCYAGMRDGRWGWTDEAVAALEGMQRHLGQPRERRRSPTKKQRRG